MSKPKNTPYAKIRKAALARRGCSLTSDECATLYYGDTAIQWRADLDAAGADCEEDLDTPSLVLPDKKKTNFL